MLGLDYSAGRIAADEILRAGFSFVIRYIDDPTVSLNNKHIRPDEYAELCKAGVCVFLVFEVDIADALGGFDQGVINAKRARAGADWIGYPNPGLIFFCSDRHLTPDQVPCALAYLDGAASVLGRASVGAYGFWDMIDPAIAQNKAGVYWQCGIAPASTDPVHMWQKNDGYTTVAGISCDVNEMLIPIPDPRTTTPSPSRGSEDAMALIDFPATPLPEDISGVRWQDTDPSTWPRSPEQKTALVACGPGTWRGDGALSALSCGWAMGNTRGDTLAEPTLTYQDGPDSTGKTKPSGYLEFVRVFYFPDGPAHGNWRVIDLWDKVALIGNRSLPAVKLPPFCTLLTASYAAPGGLYLAFDYEH